MSFPLISILIPVYNNHDYLDRLLKSILQYNGVFQIVVSDDNPLNRYSGKYLTSKDVIWNFNKKNIGRCRNYLKLLDFVNCEYFMFMDGDDELSANLSWQSILNSFHLGDIVIGNYKVNNGNKIHEVLKFKKGVVPARDFFLNWISWRLNPANGSCLYRSTLLQEMKFDDLERDILNWDIHWQRNCILTAENICFINECIFIWNYTGENGSLTSSLIEDIKNYSYISSVFVKATNAYGIFDTSIWFIRSSLIYCWFLFLKYIWRGEKL